MKNIFIILFGFIFYNVYSQGHIWREHYDRFDNCGTWVKSKLEITPWGNNDTIYFDKRGDTNWVYSDWKYHLSMQVTLQYCPCGCEHEDRWSQNRISGRGINQTRWKIQHYEYIPKPKSAYESKMAEVEAKKPKDTATSRIFLMPIKKALISDTLYKFTIDTAISISHKNFYKQKPAPKIIFMDHYQRIFDGKELKSQLKDGKCVVILKDKDSVVLKDESGWIEQTFYKPLVDQCSVSDTVLIINHYKRK